MTTYRWQEICAPMAIFSCERLFDFLCFSAQGNVTPKGKVKANKFREYTGEIGRLRGFTRSKPIVKVANIFRSRETYIASLQETFSRDYMSMNAFIQSKHLFAALYLERTNPLCYRGQDIAMY